jgi:tetratricopeptide (TPR) repeat protein
MSNWVAKLFSAGFRFTTVGASILLVALLLVSQTWAQVDDLGDGAVDPIKLFERGQNAHAHGDVTRALQYYEQAIKLRPDFPEAEFQRGVALVLLGRPAEAEPAFRRAIELRQDWSLPYSSLGTLLVRTNRDREAEPLLRRAIKLDAQDIVALRTLADIRLRAGDSQEAVELARRATNDPEAPAAAWILRGIAERKKGDKAGAKDSLDRALQLEPENVIALAERADWYAEANDYEHAIEDLKKAEQIKPNDKQILSRLLGVYERAGKTEEAQHLAESLGLVNKPADAVSDGTIKVVGTPEEITAANSDNPAKARQAVEALLLKNPRNAMLLAKLGASYRSEDPARSLDLYRRAVEIEPKNPDYATGYAAALVQARRFGEAAVILQRVISAAPGNYLAHANLATALYELKQFAAALPEYEWMLKSKPDLIVADFFIATAHDKLGEFPEALAAYETFLARADAKTNELEIEKVKLRLPSLRQQIKLGQGTKRKP